MPPQFKKGVPAAYQSAYSPLGYVSPTAKRLSKDPRLGSSTIAYQKRMFKPFSYIVPATGGGPGIRRSKEGVAESWSLALPFRMAPKKKAAPPRMLFQPFDAPLKRSEFQAPHETSPTYATITTVAPHGIGLFRQRLMPTQQTIPGALFKPKIVRSRARRVGRPLAEEGLRK